MANLQYKLRLGMQLLNLSFSILLIYLIVICHREIFSVNHFIYFALWNFSYFISYVVIGMIIQSHYSDFKLFVFDTLEDEIYENIEDINIMKSEHGKILESGNLNSLEYSNFIMTIHNYTNLFYTFEYAEANKAFEGLICVIVLLFSPIFYILHTLYILHETCSNWRYPWKKSVESN